MAPLDAEQLRFAQTSSTPLGVLRTTPATIVIGILTAVGATFALYGTGLVAFDHETKPLWLAVILAFTVCTVLAVRFVVLIHGRRAYARVIAWAQSLPFPVHGLERVLGQPPAVGAGFRVLAADAGAFAAAVRTSDPANQVIVVDEGVNVVRPWISGRTGVGWMGKPTEPLTNYPTLRWFRSLVTQVLVPAHTTTPIRHVTLG